MGTRQGKVVAHQEAQQYQEQSRYLSKVSNLSIEKKRDRQDVAINALKPYGACHFSFSLTDFDALGVTGYMLTSCDYGNSPCDTYTYSPIPTAGSAKCAQSFV